MNIFDEEKDPAVKDLKKKLAGELINLALNSLTVTCDRTVTHALVQGLACLYKGVQAGPSLISEITTDAVFARQSGGFSCVIRSGDTAPYDADEMCTGHEGSLKQFILSALTAAGKNAYLAEQKGFRDENLDSFFYSGITSLAGTLPWTYMTGILLQTGTAFLRSMELAAEADSSAADSGIEAPESCASGTAAGLKNGSIKEIILSGGCGCLFPVRGRQTFYILQQTDLPAGPWKEQVYRAGSLLEALDFLDKTGTALKISPVRLPVEIHISEASPDFSAFMFSCAALGYRKIYVHGRPAWLTETIEAWFRTSSGIEFLFS